MAKFTVTHSCGHEAPHAFSGTEAQRKQREEWLRSLPCQVCWRAERSRATEAQLEEWNLPALAGTEEERAWAEVVRAKAIAHSRVYHKEVTDPRKYPPGDEAIHEAVVAAADKALEELENHSSAAWWIENRFEALNYLKRQIVAAIAPILEARAGQ